MTTHQTTQSPWRQKIEAAVSHPQVQAVLITLIIVNAVMMGLETSDYVREHYSSYLQVADEVILGIFVIEIIALLLARGLAFFKDGWAVFDFIVIAIALVPASGPFAVLRALRVLRVLRLATKVPSLHKVVSGLLAAIPGLGSRGPRWA